MRPGGRNTGVRGQAIGGRNREPATAGKRPASTVETRRGAPGLPTASTTVLGRPAACGQAQWQEAPSPSKQSPSPDGAWGGACTVMAETVRSRTEEPSRWPPSARHTDPLISLISNTATTNAHRPRWRRRRLSSGRDVDGIVGMLEGRPPVRQFHPPFARRSCRISRGRCRKYLYLSQPRLSPWLSCAPHDGTESARGARDGAS